MGTRDVLRRLERAARGNLESFELLDGSRYYYDPSSWELFDHWCKCIRAGSAHNWPEPPEIMRKLTQAKNPKAVLEQMYPEGSGAFYSIVYDPEVLINERRLEPRGLVTRYDPETGKHHVRDPYEEQPDRDLSEQARRSRENPEAHTQPVEDLSE